VATTNNRVVNTHHSENKKATMTTTVAACLIAASFLVVALLGSFLVFQSRQRSVAHQLLPSLPLPEQNPVFVVVGGAPRSGSTLLYNMARILVRRYDPNIIAGWSFNEEELKYWTKQNVSVVIKTHSYTNKWYSTFANQENLTRTPLLVLAQRDPYEEGCSLIHKDGRLDHGMCQKIVCEEYHLRQHLEHVYTLDFRRLEQKEIYDEELAFVLTELNNALGLPSNNLQDERAIQEVANELSRLRPVAFEQHHPVTLIHSNHVSPPNKWEICNVNHEMQQLRADPLCQRLATNGGKLEQLFDDVSPAVLLNACFHV
jgi:hypothetical protein